MSTLTSALNTAKSSLSATQAQTALVSRNIANANTEGATRKYANVVTGAGGIVQVLSVAQSSNSVLFRNMLDSTSGVAQSTVVQKGLERINEMIGDIANGQTPAALIGKLTDALDAYAKSPNNYDFARTAADAAKDVATALNQGTETVDTIRRDADDQLADAATDMTRLLSKIQDLNDRVVMGTATNRDVTDLVDQRDQAVAELSQFVGVTAKTRGNNDLVLYTDSGVTLFDKVPRTVGFVQTHPLADGQDGNGFQIDGVLVTGANAMMPLKSGKIAGLVDLRDHVAVSYQNQLDEMARGLVAATAERPATGADVPGIFTSLNTLALRTTSKVDVGTFAAGSLANGNVMTFDLQLGGTTYKVSGELLTADFASATAFAAKLQTMIAAAVPAGGTGTLGADHVAVTADGSGKITLSAGGTGAKLALGISNFASRATLGTATNDATAKTGGLVAATAEITNTTIPGLARLISVSSAVTANAAKIRDGVGVTYNTANAGGYTARINALIGNLTGNQSFAGGTETIASGTLAAFATSSTSWLQDKRSSATSTTEYKQTLLDQTKTVLSNETGINLDTESLKMLELERSYQASSKVLTTIDQMLKTLMEAI
ncbi:flagellar hook-associated protein FlgK [Aureimonas leprariae]|uniref:Flagellar hook-associated protein 1 n=1 Tax=Plantimonas leprariae TaxID=2615207 RepID=A0A7V7TZY9_9HYPH|nr:flagellar hook-associated protein FlgK [Aureimonas leprariae]KAB0679896.1 flagellar hook-associated protein FlgK [Aureimonas leprariae]